MNGGVRKSPPMHGDFNDATINDFTCSLTNHNVRWLTIYSDGMLHLANTDLFMNIQLCQSRASYGMRFRRGVADVSTMTSPSP